MKITISVFLILLAFLGSFAGLAGELPADTAAAKAEFDKTIQKIQENMSKEVEQAASQYMANLRAVFDRSMEERKLEEAVAVQQEIDRIRPLMPASEEGLREGLVLYLSFDKAEDGGKATDKSGKGNHGKVIGARWIAEGKKGGAYEFTSNGNQIQIHNKPLLNPKQITLAAWIKTSFKDGQYRRIFDKSAGKGIAISVMGDMTNGGRFNRGKVILEIGPNSWNISDSVVADGQWHHVLGAYNGSDQRLYIDGQLQKQMPRWNGRVLENDFNFTIGCNQSNPDEKGLSFQGIIDEVMIYSRALSPKEVLLLVKNE
jgi:hypothetical protein